MKYLIIFVASGLLACNGEKAAEASDPALSQEKQLLADVRQYPDSALLVENLVQFYRENGEYDKALAGVDKALQKDTTASRFWHIKGILHYENEDTLKAIEALENSNRLLPNANDVLLLSKLYAETKNPLSLQLADLLIKQGQFTKEAILIKGLYYKSVGDKRNAMLYFDEAITAAYTFVEAYREKALLHYSNAEYMEALRVLDKAVKIQASYAEGYFLMGQCFEKLNRPEDAKESYETALIYQADYEEASKALASVNKLLQ